MNYEAVYRTAPATPGLLISYRKSIAFLVFLHIILALIFVGSNFVSTTNVFGKSGREKNLNVSTP